MIYPDIWMYPCSIHVGWIGFLLGSGVPYAEHYIDWRIVWVDTLCKPTGYLPKTVKTLDFNIFTACPYLAPQDALEVMRVTYLLSHLLTHG